MTAVVLSKLPEVHFQTVVVSLCTTAILPFSNQSFRLCCSIPLSWTKIWPATPHMQRNSLSHPAGTVICSSDHAKDESEKGEMCLKSFKCMLDLTQTRSLGVMGSRRLLGRFASGERPGGRFRERHPRGHHTFPKASSEKVLAFPDSSYSILKSEVACVQT